MATISLADVAFRTLPHHLFVSTGIGGSNSYAHAKKYSLNCRIPSKSKRKFVYKSDSLFKTRAVARCSMGDSGEASIDIAGNEDSPELEINEDDFKAARRALYEAQSKQQALEKERDQLLKELSTTKHKQQELLTMLMHEKKSSHTESVFLKEKVLNEMNKDATVVNGGRLALVIDDESSKLKLLSEGPRREIPVWMARRIDSVRTKFPPRKIDISEANTSNFKSLELPNPAEVWSIAQAKPKDDDTLIDKELIEKKRKALERALQRKTVQTQKTPEEIKLEPGTGTGREIVFQGFNWESCRKKWYQDLAPKAADLSRCGITAVWLPPPTESVAPQGYMPSDLYNLNSAYGTQDDLKYCIEELHNQHLLALGDVVLNHRCAHKQSENGVWNIFGGKLAWGPEAIVCDDPNFQGRGGPSSGDIFHAAPNVDHSQDFVRNDVKEWLNWLRNNIAYDGWCLDFVRGFSGEHVKEYIEASNPAFAIGEYWDSLAYEGGDLCYNQCNLQIHFPKIILIDVTLKTDAHRQRVINWINATGGTSSALMSQQREYFIQYCITSRRLIDPKGKPTGVMGWWPSRAVTFIENHDTGSTQGHWPFPRDKLMQGYAYILTHPGTVSCNQE